MSERTALLQDVPSKRKGWHYGVCVGMSGCAWAQFNDESWTYQHFPNERDARAYADRQTELGVPRD